MLKLKSAFTLIELIFAIVIIGIAALSLPMMSQVTAVGSERSLAQEAIFIAFTEITKVTSSAWDENSRVGNDDFEHIIFTTNAEEALGLSKRSGNINILYNTDAARTIRPSALGFDANDFDGAINREDDIDDYIITGANATGTVGSASGYKFQYTKDIGVSASSSFGTLVNNPNIKRMQIDVHDNASGNLLVRFYMYAMNSGSVANHPWRVLE
ncbi:type II secretion system GspH family protein [bacterium]|nr:type II secretion system GspH family protein [bacterium]MBU1433990.1 type II secretion system GspH family protein [bacterium]MBU1502972.1 type II secretion system GspH family protein [bacterium]